MGRRGRAAGNTRGNGIILDFAKPAAKTSSTGSSLTFMKKSEQLINPKVLLRSDSCSPVVFLEETEIHYEKFMSDLCDKESVENLIRSWKKISERRAGFQTANAKPIYEEFEALRNSKKLDSTLKRCNGFVRKLKNFIGKQPDTEKEIEVLNLTKYLSEICAAISEIRFKEQFHIWDILCICSKLHQRYQEFSASMLDIYKTKFTVKLGDCDWNTVYSDLRLLTELVICGLVSDEGFPLIVSCLRQLVAVDKETSGHMNIMLAFTKEFGIEVAGILPKNIQHLCNTFGITVPPAELVQPMKRLKVKFLVKEYLANVCSNLSKVHEEVIKSELICRKMLKTKGEVIKDREDSHKEILNIFEKFHTLAKKLVFYADVDLPKLQELPPDEEDDMPNLESDLNENESVSRATFFDDEETRSFYQDLPDLTKYLTSAARRENILILEKQAADLREAEANLDEELEIAELQADTPMQTTEVDLEPETEAVTNPQSQDPESTHQEEKSDYVIPPKYNEYLLGLHNCVNRNMIDSAAEMFLSTFNNKPNRKKLLKAIVSVPRQRMDLLPLWSRLIAILKPVLPEVATEVIESLKKDFRYLLRRCHPTFIETKLKIIRFIAELVNFEVFPPIDAFCCLRILLVNFVHHQLEMACAFIECCGRYLYKNPATRRRMKIYMDQMMRKKQAKALAPRYSDLVEQVYCVVFPAEGGVKHKLLPLLEAFLQDIVYFRLDRKNLEDTIILLRRLDWDNSKTFATATRVFSQPWKIAANRFSTTCSLLAGIHEHQELFGFTVADTIINYFMEGLAIVDIVNNQHLVSLVQYICELFSYQILTHDCILQLLYALIVNGVSFDYKRPSRCDPPRSSFRMRLVCVLLKGCGDYFLDDDIHSEKIKCFLKYLQRYTYFKKENPIWDTANMLYSVEPFVVVEELISHLFPKMKLYKTYEEACKHIKKMESRLYKKYSDKFVSNNTRRGSVKSETGLPNIQECEEDEEATVKQPENLRGYSQVSALGYECPSEPFFPGASNYNFNYNPWLSDGGGDMGDIGGFESESVELETEEAAMNEFDQQMNRMVLEANRSAPRDNRHVNADIRIPMNLQKTTGEEQPTGTIAYAVLLKKGNKANIKHIDVPEDSEFVKRMRRREAIEREERAQLKQRTLQINRLQIDEEMQELSLERN